MGEEWRWVKQKMAESTAIFLSETLKFNFFSAYHRTLFEIFPALAE
jgi:hypothetical protein